MRPRVTLSSLPSISHHEPVVAEPGAHGAVHDDSQGVDRVEAETDGDEGGRVVERGLHWMHGSSTEEHHRQRKKNELV